MLRKCANCEILALCSLGGEGLAQASLCPGRAGKWGLRWGENVDMRKVAHLLGHGTGWRCCSPRNTLGNQASQEIALAYRCNDHIFYYPNQELMERKLLIVTQK